MYIHTYTYPIYIIPKYNVEILESAGKEIKRRRLLKIFNISTDTRYEMKYFVVENFTNYFSLKESKRQIFTEINYKILLLVNNIE